MSDRDDGGPAFPNYGVDVWEHGCWVPMPQEGMTLRDYFAGQALLGLITKFPLMDQEGEFGKAPVDMLQIKLKMAESAYWYADAMLEARKRLDTPD